MKTGVYLYNKWVDWIFILIPPFISLLIVVLLPGQFKYTAQMPLSAWVMLVLLIDVGHVYATLFRTYLDQETFSSQKNLMRYIPLFCGVIAMMVYSMSDIWFWRLLAYMAVFHFIRQQYGFMRIYSRVDVQVPWRRSVDAIAIYSATIYPLLYWHLNGERNFNWFIKGDFVDVHAPGLSHLFFAVYVVILFVYVVKEIIVLYRERSFNIPKNMVVLGTACSWYFGIVYYNGDLAFTLLNVVAHGIPYMALVWIWGRKKMRKSGFETNRLLKITFKKAGLFVFIGLIIVLAFIEEGLWDALVWREYAIIFPFWNDLLAPAGKDLLRLVVPLLALPQIVHYVIDGYIWKIKNDRSDWSKHVLK